MTPRLTRACLTCLLWISGALPVLAQETSPVVFSQELDRIQRKVEQGSWSSAARHLESILESHRDQSYVLGHLGEIELLMKRCDFWKGNRDQDAKQLFKGDLRRYTERSGTIELRYDKGQPDDWEWVREANFPMHPVSFNGPYSIEFKDCGVMSFVVCIGERSLIQVLYSKPGFVSSGSAKNQAHVKRKVEIILVSVDARGERVEKTTSEDFETSGKSKKEDLLIEVSSSRVTAKFNGKAILSVNKPGGLYGRIAKPTDFLVQAPSRITIKGNAGDWIQGKLDEQAQVAWASFEAKWKFEDHAPAWLLGEFNEAPAQPEHESSIYGTRAEELPQALASVWNAMIDAHDAQDYETSEKLAGQLLAKEPNLGQASYVRGQALFALRQRKAGLALLSECLERYPRYEDAAVFLAEAQLVTGRFQACLDTIKSAVAAGIPARNFQSFSLTANKGLHGPSWRKKNTYASRHYSVSSDLSRDVCRKIALQLEETFRHVSARLAMGQHTEDRKFVVYVFSGQASYLDYIRGVFGGSGEHTTGMYSQSLKQLLILGGVDNEELLNTTRHEGFHQFLDSTISDVPIWLNEGLAEYFASSRSPFGEWKDGRIDQGHLQELRSAGSSALIPLNRFVRYSQERFMRGGAASYAQAWAFVHFLRHSSIQNKDTFKLIMAELEAGSSSFRARTRAFAGRDWKAMDLEFAQYIEKL